MAQGLRIRAAAGDTIRYNGTASTAAGAIESSTLYGSLTLIAVNATYWHVLSAVGTWTFVA